MRLLFHLWQDGARVVFFLNSSFRVAWWKAFPNSVIGILHSLAVFSTRSKSFFSIFYTFLRTSVSIFFKDSKWNTVHLLFFTGNFLINFVVLFSNFPSDDNKANTSFHLLSMFFGYRIFDCWWPWCCRVLNGLTAFQQFIVKFIVSKSTALISNWPLKWKNETRTAYMLMVLVLPIFRDLYCVSLYCGYWTGRRLEMGRLQENRYR